MYRIYADDKLLYSPELMNEGYCVISPKLTMELNKAGSLQFLIPTNNVMYDKLNKLKTTIIVKQDDNEIWRGRILHDEKDFYKRKSVYCEGELSFLFDTIQRPYEFSGGVSKLLQFYISEHQKDASDGRRFSYGGCTVTDPNDYIVRSNSDYTSHLEEITEKLVKKLGGYLKIVPGGGGSRNLWYVTEYGKVSSQVIEFGVNMLDLTEYINAESVFTVLIPLGAREETDDGTEGRRLTVESVNNGVDYIEDETAVSIFGRIVRTETWDDVTIAGNLLTKGREFLQAGIEMSVTLSIKAVDLHLINVNTDAIGLGDYIRVVSVPHGLDKHFICSKIVLDMQNPDKSEYTLGTGFSAMTDMQVSNQKKTNTAYTVAENASNTISSINVNVAGNYVSKSDFASYQSQVNQNFEAVNTKLTAVFHYKGTVAKTSDLPSSGNVIGDTYNVSSSGANYAWSGTEWDKLSESVVEVDLTNYVSMDKYNSLLARVERLEENGVNPDPTPDPTPDPEPDGDWEVSVDGEILTINSTKATVEGETLTINNTEVGVEDETLTLK